MVQQNYRGAGKDFKDSMKKAHRGEVCFFLEWNVFP